VCISSAGLLTGERCDRDAGVCSPGLACCNPCGGSYCRTCGDADFCPPIP
jgi:hypothetical protein